MSTHTTSRVHPGLVLCDDERLIWNGITIEQKDGKYKTPDGLISASNLRLLLSMNISLPTKYWDKVTFCFADGNEENHNPKNVVPVFKDGAIECEERQGYFFVPYFTSYVVNKNGDVVNWRRDVVMAPYIAGVGYKMFGLTGDDGKRTIVGQHRILALAFIKYDRFVRKLDVNHIDGCKLNNALENLEFVSRKRNCDHAYQTGLRDDNVVVQVKSVFTKEVFQFYSISECARVLGMAHTVVLQRLKSDGQRVFRNGFLFKSKASQTPWLEVDATKLTHLGIGCVSKFRLRKDDFVLETDSYSQVGAITGVCPSVVRWRLDNWPHPIKLNDYECDLIDMSVENKSDCAVMRRSKIS